MTCSAHCLLTPLVRSSRALYWCLHLAVLGCMAMAWVIATLLTLVLQASWNLFSELWSRLKPLLRRTQKYPQGTNPHERST